MKQKWTSLINVKRTVINVIGLYKQETKNINNLSLYIYENRENEQL